MNSENLREKICRDWERKRSKGHFFPLMNLRSGFCTPFKTTYLDENAQLIQLWKVFEIPLKGTQGDEVIYDDAMEMYGIAKKRVFLGHCRDLGDALYEAAEDED